MPEIVSDIPLTEEQKNDLLLDDARDALKADLMAMRKPRSDDHLSGEPDHALNFAEKILSEIWHVPARGSVARDKTHEHRVALRERLSDARNLIHLLRALDARLPSAAR